ncbi:hypothetical protein TNCV_1850211 [Trichonephila clavipes]|nr:hypothetical protein TNCV_1850211 [Trichonephila clavipes]
MGGGKHTSHKKNGLKNQINFRGRGRPEKPTDGKSGSSELARALAMSDGVIGLSQNHYDDGRGTVSLLGGGVLTNGAAQADNSGADPPPPSDKHTRDFSHTGIFLNQADYDNIFHK